MGLFRETIKDDFIIVAIIFGFTMDAENNQVMVSAIESTNSSY
jgi:hypothetical protein